MGGFRLRVLQAGCRTSGVLGFRAAGPAGVLAFLVRMAVSEEWRGVKEATARGLAPQTPHPKPSTLNPKP